MIAYIIKSTICLVLLLAFYHFVLEKEKMHRFNRFYLLGAIIFSFMVPSFIITVAPAEFVEPILNQQENVLQFQSELTTTEIVQEIDYTNYFIGLYCIISLVLLFLLTKKIYQLLEQTKRNKKVSYFSATVVLLKEKIVPYTFLHYIFINKKKYKTNAVEQQILTHELTHVQQKHSLDVLFIEVLQILFWFNPIFRYYKKAIQLNHEFLADDAVIKSHKNIAEYQYVLLNTTAQQNNIYLASNLNYSLTKKRLLMMTTPSSKTKILLKKLMVIPLTAGFIFAFAQRVEAQEKLPQVVEANINYNNDIEAVKVEESRTSYNGIMYAYTIKNNGNKKISSKDYTIVFKVDDRLVQFNEELPDLYPGKTFKNDSGYTFYSNLKRNNKTKDFDEIKPRASINYSLEIKYIDANIENNTINGISIFDKRTPQIIKKQEGISEKEMKEYKALFNKGSESKIYKVKDVEKMISLYKKMSKKQQQSVTDIRKVIPPPPPPIKRQEKVSFHKSWFITIDGQKYYYTFDKNERVAKYYKNGKLVNLDIVKEYKKKHKIYENLKATGKHYVFKSENDKKEIDREFSDLGGMYFRMSRADKNKVPFPNNPHGEYVKLIRKDDSYYYKKRSELNAEDKKLLSIKFPPPPPPLKKNATKKEIERYNKALESWKKKIKNIPPPPPPKKKEIKVFMKKNNITPLSSNAIQELKATEKLRIAHEKKHKSLNLKNNDSRAVVSGGKMKMSLLETVKMWSKKGAGFVYNNKAITAKKGIEIVSKNKNIRVYSVEEERGKPILVFISDKK
ncbi:Regulatory protein BlaR1 [Polaribacter huanghezhanensis]|uniref:M56 family metallopeptidase n=1 Tax=Polaribacter huanghezhanensis TaxID=1354726 RepID=UPI002648B84D|nr:M56 family metallopeptidase [Polaribacter huanghezhanensis]WKD85977.1 Regulatory protein BlaR1 [Polaribacter huanghezhanensis]